MRGLLLAVLLVAAGAAADGGPAAGLAEAFRARCAAYAEEARTAGRMAVAAPGGWRFLASELRHLAGDGSHPDRDDPVAVIADFSAQLKRAGVALLVVPVPEKAAVYADVLVPEAAPGPGGVPPRPDAGGGARLEALRAAGVEVVDLWPVLSASRYLESGPAWCRTDTHWSGLGCRLAAAAIAERLRAGGLGPGRLRPVGERREVSIRGDLAEGTESENLVFEFAGFRKGGRFQPVPEDSAGPLLLLGDSHCLVFHAGGDLHAAGAGLADHLALELQLAADVMGVRGSGAGASRVSLLRRIRADPAWWKRKRHVVWCFAAREFTLSRWKTMSVVP